MQGERIALVTKKESTFYRDHAHRLVAVPKLTVASLVMTYSVLNHQLFPEIAAGILLAGSGVAMILPRSNRNIPLESGFFFGHRYTSCDRFLDPSSIIAFAQFSSGAVLCGYLFSTQDLTGIFYLLYALNSLALISPTENYNTFMIYGITSTFLGSTVAMYSIFKRVDSQLIIAANAIELLSAGTSFVAGIKMRRENNKNILALLENTYT
jgi:hypothetical protein